MVKKKQTVTQKDGSTHYSKLPRKVLEEMTPEIKRQYFLWDEILKRQIERYPLIDVAPTDPGNIWKRIPRRNGH